MASRDRRSAAPVSKHAQLRILATEAYDAERRALLDACWLEFKPSEIYRHWTQTLRRHWGMPLLASVAKKLPKSDDQARTLIVGVQHLLVSQVPVFEILIEQGFAPSNILLLGKSYSTSSYAAQALRGLGLTVVDPLESTGPMHPSGAAPERAIESLKHHARNRISQLGSSLSQLIVLDDGGLAREACAEIFSHKPLGAKWKVVEQTTRGLRDYTEHTRRMGSEPLLARGPMPDLFVNVAQHRDKRKLESPAIGYAILKRALESVAARGFAEDSIEVVINGFGAIGAGVAQVCTSANIPFRAYDPSSRRRKLVPEGPDGSAQVLLPGAELPRASARVVVSTTGVVGAGAQIAKRVGSCTEQVFLVSGSSGDLEFGREFHRDTMSAGAYPTRVERYARSSFVDTHDDYTRDGFVLVNGGNPANFDGAREHLGPDDIQLTRALMLCGISQALGGEGTVDGYMPTDLRTPQRVFGEYRRTHGPNAVADRLAPSIWGSEVSEHTTLDLLLSANGEYSSVDSDCVARLEECMQRLPSSMHSKLRRHTRLLADGEITRPELAVLISHTLRPTKRAQLSKDCKSEVAKRYLCRTLCALLGVRGESG